MITVIIYGLDQFVVGRLSRELTPNLAKLYETSEDEINFIAPQDMVFHAGVEQTSWNLIIHVHAPLKVSVLQDQVAKFLLEGIGDVAIHKTVEFYYYSQDNRFQKINPSYPRYLTSNELDDEEEYYQEGEECECHHDHEEEEDYNEEDIYTGNIFEDFNKKK